MFNVKHTKPLLSRPGSKVRFNSNELLVHMPCELVYPFLPHMGRARDPYCGKMTTVIAFLPTGRQCIRNKKTYDVLKAAIQLLFAFLPSRTQPKRHLNRKVLWSFRKQSSQVTLRQKCYPTYPPQKTQMEYKTEEDECSERDGATEETENIRDHPGPVSA